jgi:hypothetical protein
MLKRRKKDTMNTSICMKNAVFWDVAPCTDVSEEHIASIFRVEKSSLEALF